jgi:hypothetical protein
MPGDGQFNIKVEDAKTIRYQEKKFDIPLPMTVAVYPDGPAVQCLVYTAVVAEDLKIWSINGRPIELLTSSTYPRGMWFWGRSNEERYADFRRMAIALYDNAQLEPPVQMEISVYPDGPVSFVLAQMVMIDLRTREICGINNMPVEALVTKDYPDGQWFFGRGNCPEKSIVKDIIQADDSFTTFIMLPKMPLNVAEPWVPTTPSLDWTAEFQASNALWLRDATAAMPETNNALTREDLGKVLGMIAETSNYFWRGGQVGFWGQSWEQARKEKLERQKEQRRDSYLSDFAAQTKFMRKEFEQAALRPTPNVPEVAEDRLELISLYLSGIIRDILDEAVLQKRPVVKIGNKMIAVEYLRMAYLCMTEPQATTRQRRDVSTWENLIQGRFVGVDLSNDAEFTGVVVATANGEPIGEEQTIVLTNGRVKQGIIFDPTNRPVRRFRLEEQ